jgi:uncharacterized protein (TIGR02147 family)
LAAAPSIFAYRSLGAFLSAHMAWRRDANPKFSYRYLVKRLKLKSTSAVAMIATGKRLPTPKFLAQLFAELELGAAELAYAEALIALAKAKGDEERQLYLDKLDQLRPAEAPATIALDAFEFIAKWHNIAVLEMVELSDFVAEPAWIAARLGGAIDAAQAAASLELLQRLGLLARDDDGKLARTAAAFSTPFNVPSAAIRHYHGEILDLAKQALHGQAVNERFFAGTTIPMAVESLPEAERLVAECRRKLARLAQKPGERQEVYHFSVQLFRLTKPGST